MKSSWHIFGSSNQSAAFLPIFIIALIAFGVYFNTLFNGFVDDDGAQVLRNPWITDIKHLPDMFSKSVWSFLKSDVSNYYRPMMHVTYMINYHIFGLQAWGFHLVNVLFHMGNSVLAFLLIERLLGSSYLVEHTSTFLSPPFIAAVLFAVHPIHTEAVAWVAALPESAFTFFCLLSFYFFILSKERVGVRHAASVIIFFVALLFKETAVTLPIILLIYDLVLRGNRRVASHHLKIYAPYVAAAAIYFIMRYRVLSGLLAPLKEQTGISSYQLVINVLPLFKEYLEKMLLPLNLNFWHPFHPIASLFTVDGTVSLIVVLLFVCCAAVALKKNRIAFLALVIILVPLLPAFYIAGLPKKPFAERYLYFPSFGFVMLAALLFSWLLAKYRKGIGIFLMFVTIAALYSAGTISRNAIWKDDYVLLSDTVKRAPDAAIPRYNLAIAMMNDRGEVDDAIEQFGLLIKKHPHDVQVAQFHAAFGHALLMKNRLDEAIGELKLAFSLDPNIREAYLDLGVALRQKGMVKEAIAHYETALRIDPDYAEAHFNLANALAGSEQLDEAIGHYKAALKLEPGNAFYRNMLGITYGQMGMYDEAFEQFKEAVRLRPEEPAYRKNLERAEGLKGPAGKQ